MIRVISWNNGESARALSQAISNGKLVLNSSIHTPVPTCDMLVNLGCTQICRPTFAAVRIINAPHRVAVASSKAETARRIGGLMPRSFTNKEEAAWFSLENGYSLVARTIDNGHSGAGIAYFTAQDIRDGFKIPDAKLYTVAINKRREYRVHVGCIGSYYYVIDVCRKVRRSGVDDTDRPFIWNHGNDFIFQREGVTEDSLPASLLNIARTAVSSLGLHFGAVDIIVEKGFELRRSPCYVLEVNTSPGMEGRTLERYAEYFKALAGDGTFTDWRDLPPFTPSEEDNG